jgi:hypothetical protein
LKLLKKLKLPRIRLPSIKIKYEAIQELAVLAGFFMFLYGLWQIYPPAMWIIGGLWLMYPGRSSGRRGG